VTATATVQDKFGTAYQSRSSSRTPINKEQAQVKDKNYQFTLLRRKVTALFAAPLVVLCLFSIPSSVAAAQSQTAGLGNAVVHTAFGGFILGYDIDRTGTEGLLAESNGGSQVAVETFDQATGKILKVVTQQKGTNNDFVVFGIFGNSVGLVEEELSSGEFVSKRVYGVMNPLDGNKFTGKWTPPFTKDDIVREMATSQGSPTTPVLYFDNTGNDFSSLLIATDVAANKFGTPFTIPDTVFDWDNSPVMAYDTETNQAVLGGSLGCFGCSTEIGLVNLADNKFSEFPGLGFGFINGIAVDSSTGIACTTTEDDFSVEFYNLATQTGFIEPLQGATNQANSGGDVEFDPIHKLFLIGQEFSSVARSGSSILVYDEKGNFIEAVNGLSLPASPAYMALHPSKRAGYVIVTPGLNELQSFTY
jgi:hypothetical protein